MQHHVAMRRSDGELAWRHVAAVTVAGGCLLAGCGASSQSASASCAPPQIRVDSGAVPAGEVVELQGTFFTDTCADHSYPDPVHPLRGLSITIEQAGKSQLVSRVDAYSSRGTFQSAVRLPLTLKKGPAAVHVGSAAHLGTTAVAGYSVA